MNTLLFILLAVIALSSYACGYWYEKLFKDDGKPSKWRFPRLTNDDRYSLSERTQLCLVIIFVVVSLLSLGDITISLGTYIIILVMAAVVPVILGSYCGKHI
jgi:hypothetical protein